MEDRIPGLPPTLLTVPLPRHAQQSASSQPSPFAIPTSLEDNVIMNMFKESQRLRWERAMRPAPTSEEPEAENGQQQRPSYLRICAPMVRYSKLAFRMLVRRHGVDIAYTPMIISDCFVRASAARDVEFITHPEDRPLVVQFAAHNAEDLAAAAEFVAPHCDAIDLNCGCPQRWAMSEGYGACLLRHPDKIADMVRTTTRRLPTLPVAVKIRIADKLQETVELVRRAESMGAAWITVHGRTPKQRPSHPVNYEAIRIIKESCGVPVVANGDITSAHIAEQVHLRTGVDGVMAARGMLSNPAMFETGPARAAAYAHDDDSVGCSSGAGAGAGAGAVLSSSADSAADSLEKSTCPRSVVEEWVDTALSLGTPFPCFHHHLMFMLEDVMCKSDRRDFNALTSAPAVVDYMRSKGMLSS